MKDIRLIGGTEELEDIKLPRIPLGRCVYPDGEGGFIIGKHSFDKDGYCIFCGEVAQDIGLSSYCGNRTDGI